MQFTGINQITLVSFENIDIQPSLGIRIFGPTRLKKFMETQESNIYRLVMRNPSYDAYFSFCCLGPLLGENGRGHHAHS